MQRKRATARTGLMTAALLVGVVACGTGETGSGEGLEDVVLGNATTRVTAAQSPYASLPLALGYWEEEGLDVEVLGLSGSGNVVQAVDAGQVDVGTAGTSSLLPAVEADAGLVAYYDLVTSNFAVPSVPESSPIQTVEDFEGAIVGVQSLDSSVVPLTRAMAASVGVSPDSMQFRNIGDGASALALIEKGEVDVVGLSDSARSSIENLGFPLRVVATDEFRNLGFNYPLVVTEETLAERRDVLIGVARGIAKAQVFLDENPEAAVRLNWQVYPESKPAGVSDEEALRQALLIVDTRAEYTEPISETYGLALEESVAKQIELAVDAGVISEPLSVEEVWTDALLAEINDFDEDAIRRQARDYQVD